MVITLGIIVEKFFFYLYLTNEYEIYKNRSLIEIYVYENKKVESG